MVLPVRILGTGPPVVLLPWFGLDQAVMAAAFEPVFAATSGWCRIYVDLPGTGQSPAIEPRCDAVLETVLETVGPITRAPFLVAGCSYGGYLAAGLARRAPAQVAGLLMVCPGVKILPADRNLDHVLPSEPEPGWLRDVPTELHDHFSRGIRNQTGPVASRVARALRLAGPTELTWPYCGRPATSFLMRGQPAVSMATSPSSPAALTGSPAISTSSTHWPVTRAAATSR